MATIALYSNQIAQMSGKLGEVKQTVNDYKSELFSLKTKALAIKQSICNMEDVISSIQASTSVQEEKVDSLEQLRGSSEQFIEDTYRIDGNVAELVNKRKDDFYDQYKYLKPESEMGYWEKKWKNAKEWCKEHWKVLATAGLVLAALLVIVFLPGAALLVAMAEGLLVTGAVGGAIGGIISVITGGPFWEGYFDGAFYGAIGGLIAGGMGFFFTGAVEGVAMKLWQTLLTGGVSGIGSFLFDDLGDIVFKGEAMSWKKIVTDVIVAGGLGAAFAGIAYGLSKAFSALKLKIINKGGSKAADVSKIIDSASQAKKGGETVAGHALQKHAGRNPDIWGKVSGNSESINNAAMQHIDDILGAPGEFNIVESNGHSFLEKMLPDGRGIRLNMDGTFKGFIDQIR